MSDNSDKLKDGHLEESEEIGVGLESSEQASEELPFPVEDEHLEGASPRDWPDVKEIIDSGKLPRGGALELLAIQILAPVLGEGNALKKRELQLIESGQELEGKKLQLIKKGQELKKEELLLIQKGQDLQEREQALTKRGQELQEREQKLKNRELWLKVIGILYTILWPVLVLICRYSDKILGFLGRFSGS